MGKVRLSYIKATARELVRLYPDRFSANFDENKIPVMELTDINSKHVRNRVAGYITRLMRRAREEIERDRVEVEAEEKAAFESKMDEE